jgi:hypothetical protein
VPVFREAGAGGAREAPDGHDWLEVTALTPLEPEPVELLVAPELVELVASDEAPVPDELEVVAAAGVADWVTAVRASAGSWPLTSTTVMSIHTARNRATDPPITRARIRRTRARRSALNLMPSCLVMAGSIGPRHSNGV